MPKKFPKILFMIITVQLFGLLFFLFPTATLAIEVEIKTCSSDNNCKDGLVCRQTGQDTRSEKAIFTCVKKRAEPSPPLNTSMPSLTIPEPKLQIDIPGLTLKPVECKEKDAKGNTICKIPWIGEYVAGIYKYAIGIVGILATVVMMVGGIIWLTAGGNATRVSEAKSWIGASLTGLVIALASYMILYQVNPDLIKFKPIRVTVVKPAEKPPTIGDTCEKYNTKDVINFKTAEKSSLPSLCSSYDSYFSSTAELTDVDIKILKAIAATESDCEANKTSPAGACGIMQLLPSTAQAYPPGGANKNDITCDWLKSHPKESIQIAGQYIASNQKDREKIFAGYNGGYGASANNGKKGPLSFSTDCPGVFAYQCCKNPGELTETQDYIFKATKYYNGQ